MGGYRRRISAVVATIAKGVALISGREETRATGGVCPMAGGAGVSQERVAAVRALGQGMGSKNER